MDQLSGYLLNIFLIGPVPAIVLYFATTTLIDRNAYVPFNVPALVWAALGFFVGIVAVVFYAVVAIVGGLTSKAKRRAQAEQNALLGQQLAQETADRANDKAYWDNIKLQ